MERITILQFTDPICVWCWGNEPVLRAIEYLYGDKVRIEFIMGGHRSRHYEQFSHFSVFPFIRGQM